VIFNKPPWVLLRSMVWMRAGTPSGRRPSRPPSISTWTRSAEQSRRDQYVIVNSPNTDGQDLSPEDARAASPRVVTDASRTSGPNRSYLIFGRSVPQIVFDGRTFESPEVLKEFDHDSTTYGQGAA